MRIIFYLINIIFILFYLYPGSLSGYILYGDFQQQPQISNDFLNISLNHFCAFIFLSFFGVWTYFNDQKINLVIKYLFTLTIILELFHIIIPERTFEYGDLLGNILGVLTIYVPYKIWKKN